MPYMSKLFVKKLLKEEFLYSAVTNII